MTHCAKVWIVVDFSRASIYKLACSRVSNWHMGIANAGKRGGGEGKRKKEKWRKKQQV
jgi:hypothetical protein